MVPSDCSLPVNRESNAPICYNLNIIRRSAGDLCLGGFFVGGWVPVVMDCEKCYGDSVSTGCWYSGHRISETHVTKLFSHQVKERLLDVKGTNALVNEFQDVTGTGFDKGTLSTVFDTASQQDSFKTWRIGESVAELFLEDAHGARFHYNLMRDSRNPKASQAGADLVGFIGTGANARFLFGEVKTSGDKSSPPNVVYGRTGLEKQIEILKVDEKRRKVLVRYLGFKVKDLPQDSAFRSDFMQALRTFVNSKTKAIHLFGVLVRDTEPSANDVKSRFQSLSKGLDHDMALGLEALYVPVAMGDWNALLNAEGSQHGS